MSASHPLKYFKRGSKMDMEDEYRYETTIEKIIFNLDQLIADILLASIKSFSW